MNDEVQSTEGEVLLPDSGPRLHYRAWAPADNAMPTADALLLHGLASSSRIWDLVGPLLATRGVRCVAPDQRGHGLSDKPDAGYDLASVAADARALGAALGLRQPLVVGHSWGAGVALTCGALHPHGVRGVVLVDGGVTSLRSRPDASWETVERDMAPPDLSAMRLSDLLERASRGDLRDLTSAFREAFFRSLMEEQADGTIRARLSRTNHLHILRGMWDADQDDLLRRARDAALPVLAILARQTGRQGREAGFLAAKQAGADTLRAAVPQAQVVWLDDTIHDIPLQRPRELADLLLGAATDAAPV